MAAETDVQIPNDPSSPTGTSESKPAAAHFGPATDPIHSTVEAKAEDEEQKEISAPPEHLTVERVLSLPLEELQANANKIAASKPAGLSNGVRGRATPKRLHTAPMPARNTPPLARKSSMLGGRAHAGRVRTMYSSRHGGFEYRFDSIESDSDSSATSSDEEPSSPQVRKRSAQKEQAAKPTAEDVAERTETPARQETGDEERERRSFFIGNDYFRTKGKVSKKDGRLKISINETANSGFIAKMLGQTIRNHLDVGKADESSHEEKKKRRKTLEEEADAAAASLHGQHPRPKLNIVIMVIGSRGDIQPFLQIGKLLKDRHGHRVRMASHPVFKDFVEQIGLEFFDVGGDPSELMAFMVKNPGLIPSVQTLREGEIGRRRAAMGEMFEGFWQACIADSEPSAANGYTAAPFIADAIIANPPSMAHVHIAERLGIPLHIMFTFPYTPTTQFPHPLANIKARRSNIDAGYVNFMSYPLVEMMTWQGLGDIVNHFREGSLRLEPVSALWAPGALYRMKVPYTYLWSPSLVPKPKDWGSEIDIAGFVFLNLAQHFEPPKELTDFLADGEPPVYIGFGSIVVDDPNAFTEMILEAVKMVGVRALISKGWGGLGRGNADMPKNVYMLGNIPHDWLFPQVRAVVHHGGAGTTAIGLKCARPTMIVPFFGDQAFWGNMVAEARAGAFECIPYKKLTAERLAEGIRQCLTDEAQQNVQRIADSIVAEGDGAENAVASFLRSLPLAGRHSMRCSILQDRVAVWKVKKSSLRLSALAAELLHRRGKFKWSELKLIRFFAWNDFDGPGEPITGGVGALTDSLYGIGEGFGMVPIRIARHIRKREEHERKKRERHKKREERGKGKTDAHPSTKSIELTNGATRPDLSHHDTDHSLVSTASQDPSEPLPAEVIDDLHWGLKRAGVAILTMPNDLSVAIAQGIHNAPRLWGDSTIRKPIKIHGVKSGMTAARKEFAYGIYDGWTGLLTQPRGEWQDADSLPAKLTGLGTGLGKGIGGFVFKNFNALFAPPAFFIEGLIKHMEKSSDGPGSKPFIRRSRIMQGEMELQALLALHSRGAHTPTVTTPGVAESFRPLPNSTTTAADGDSVDDITARVLHGWAVYQDIWRAAQQTFGPLGPLSHNALGRYKMRREWKRWDVNGALENVDTAKAALQARQEGRDVQTVLAGRREELVLAERPRTSVLTQMPTREERLGEDGAAAAVAEEEGDDLDRSDANGAAIPPAVAPVTRVLSSEGAEPLKDAVLSEQQQNSEAARPQLRSAVTVS